MGTRVLVADDSSTMRKIILRSLQAVGVTETTEAADGAEAVGLFKPGEFDMVLTDWNMPGKTGLEVVQEIRVQDSNVPIIMVTTEAEKRRVMEAIQAGVSDYLVKPFAFEELLARVRALVRRAYDTGSPVVRVADLEIDTAARVARRAGERIELTAREYALLEFLALRAGEVSRGPTSGSMSTSSTPPPRATSWTSTSATFARRSSVPDGPG